ncbi:hypothetical protein NEHOM01_1795 [Nematocida homosporus]|uniref:uncharacterized protein n=1 Tax=Nematocida homosporus TaxID=1912981 RepID=UPI00221F343A|nr:uncharacterized protein NEHOM01_1795 [Nematocida homosporus]KAI5186911.1 hypothetical protein NEHOM01_1795 [Nematocida homosporus]
MVELRESPSDSSAKSGFSYDISENHNIKNFNRKSEEDKYHIPIQSFLAYQDKRDYSSDRTAADYAYDSSDKEFSTPGRSTSEFHHPPYERMSSQVRSPVIGGQATATGGFTGPVTGSGPGSAWSTESRRTNRVYSPALTGRQFRSHSISGVSSLSLGKSMDHDKGLHRLDHNSIGNVNVDVSGNIRDSRDMNGNIRDSSRDSRDSSREVGRMGRGEGWEGMGVVGRPEEGRMNGVGINRGSLDAGHGLPRAMPPLRIFRNEEIDDSADSDEGGDSRVNKGRKKIKMEFIKDKGRRGVTFSKRKKGIMKKAYELNVLTKCEILLVVSSETGHVYTFATPKLQPIIKQHENLIQQYLNSPEIGEPNKMYETPERFATEGAGYYKNTDTYGYDGILRGHGYPSGYYHNGYDPDNSPGAGPRL